MNTTEIKIQEYLVSKKIYPFSVLYAQCLPLLKISFYLEDDIQEFIRFSELDRICDNSGIKKVKDSVLLWGVVLKNFLRNVGC